MSPPETIQDKLIRAEKELVKTVNERRHQFELGWVKGPQTGWTFSIRRAVGAGGMGWVYLAIVEDSIPEKSDQLFALKTLDFNKFSPDQLRSHSERMRREQQVMAEIRDSHLLPLVDSGIIYHGDLPIPFFIMPFVEGCTLSRKLSIWGRLPQVEAARILAETAEALIPMHEHQDRFAHRDLKPENLFLDYRTDLNPHQFVTLNPIEHVIVVDFGLAKSETMEPAPDGSVGFTLGTLGYVPRECLLEQLRLEQQLSAKPERDVFALGVIGSQLLVGSHPFAHREAVPVEEEGKQLKENELSHIRISAGDSPAVFINRSSEIKIDRELSALIEQMLSHQPEQRPSARDVSRRLRAFLRRAPMLDPQPSETWPAVPAAWRDCCDQLVRVFGFLLPEWSNYLGDQPRAVAGLLMLLRYSVLWKDDLRRVCLDIARVACTILEDHVLASKLRSTAVTEEQADAWKADLIESRSEVKLAVEKFSASVRHLFDVVTTVNVPDLLPIVNAIQNTLTGLEDYGKPAEQTGFSQAVLDAAIEVLPDPPRVYETIEAAINKMLLHQQQLVDFQQTTANFLLQELLVRPPFLEGSGPPNEPDLPSTDIRP